MMAQLQVSVVRVYEDPGRGPGQKRVLVDRLWPRGISKTQLDYDEWPKDVAPSTELRRWYGHVPERFDEFQRRYRSELAQPPGAEEIARLAGMARHYRLVLLTATRDVAHSAAAVLQAILTAGPR